MTKKNYKVLADCRGMYEQEIVDTILKNRGIKDVVHFLTPEDDDLLPPMKYMEDAAKIIEDGLDTGKQFGVFFDTDTDGVTAGTIMTRYLHNYTERVSSYINKGKAHGLIGQDISKFENVDILIIVDSLDKDTSAYEKLVKQDKQIIILDHHKIEVDYDELVTLISSQRHYDNPHLSGAGVVWKFCKYLDEYFLDDYADDLVDLAACGILADVCDVSELSTENRYIVNKGLDNLKNPAIKKILGSYEFNSKAVLFSIAPLINACCRIGRNESAMNLFLANDNNDVLKYKKEVTECKDIQLEEVDRIFPDLKKQLDSQKDNNVLYGIIDSKYGISGLLGNKCLELYNKPLFILMDKGGSYFGSMRSVGYGDFMKLCNETGLAELHGHEEASGIEIRKDNFEKFINVIDKKLSSMEQTTSFSQDVDCLINLEDLTRSLVDKVKIINKVSGEGFKPLTFKVVGIDEYEIGSFKQGKHLVITPSDNIQLIEWNTSADYEELEDDALMNEPLEVIGELDSGWFIKKFMLKVICSEIKAG